MQKLVSLAIAALLACVAQAVLAQPKEIRFGCYAPLTGPLAQYGKSMQNGMRMAIADFEATNKLPGVKFSIQCEDDQNRADDGINIARKFIEDKAVLAVLGGWASTVTLASGPVYNDAKMVNITPISSHPDVTKIGPYVFRQSIIQSAEGVANAAYLKELGIKSIAMLGLPNDYGKANIAATKGAYTAQGGKVVFEEFIRPDAQDFRQVLQKAMRENPEAIYLAMFAPQASLVVKQARQMGLQAKIYGAAALDSPEFLRLSGEAANGVRLLMVYTPAIGPKMADFTNRYKAQFNADPEPFSANSYITARTLFDVVAAQYPNVTRESIKTGLDALRSIDTIVGPLSYDPQSREWSFKFIQGVIENNVAKAVR